MATSFEDTGLSGSTSYQYAVVATSNAGTSALSATAAVQTGSSIDALSIQPRVIAIARTQSFSGVVASFADTNVLTPPGSFVATIRWGDGRVSRGTVTGSNGQFTIIGRHRFPAAGRYVVRVGVTTSAPSGSPASLSTTSTAAVRVPLHVIKRVARLGTALWRRHGRQR